MPAFQAMPVVSHVTSTASKSSAARSNAISGSWSIHTKIWCTMKKSSRIASTKKNCEANPRAAATLVRNTCVACE